MSPPRTSSGRSSSRCTPRASIACAQPSVSRIPARSRWNSASPTMAFVAAAYARRSPARGCARGETTRRSSVSSSSPSLSRSSRPIESMRAARSAPSAGVSACGRVTVAYGSACVVVTPTGLYQANTSAPPSSSPLSAEGRGFAASALPSSSSGASASRRSPRATARPAVVTRWPAMAVSAPRRERPERSATRTLTRIRSVSCGVLLRGGARRIGVGICFVATRR